MRDLLWRCDEHRGPDADFPALRGTRVPRSPGAGLVAPGESQRPASRAKEGAWLSSLLSWRSRARNEANLRLTPPCSRELAGLRRRRPRRRAGRRRGGPRSWRNRGKLRPSNDVVVLPQTSGNQGRGASALLAGNQGRGAPATDGPASTRPIYLREWRQRFCAAERRRHLTYGGRRGTEPPRGCRCSGLDEKSIELWCVGYGVSNAMRWH
jgi:hypothetical protein